MSWLRWLAAPWREHRALWEYALIQTQHITELAERVAELERKTH